MARRRHEDDSAERGHRLSRCGGCQRLPRGRVVEAAVAGPMNAMAGSDRGLTGRGLLGHGSRRRRCADRLGRRGEPRDARRHPVVLEPGRAVVLLRARGRAVARRRRADDDGRGRLRQGATGGGQDAVFQRVIMGRGEGGPRIEAHGPAARKEAMACVSALPIDRRRPYRRRRPGARIQPG